MVSYKRKYFTFIEKMLLGVLVLATPKIMSSASAGQDDSNYFHLVVSGVWQDSNNAYVSKLIQYPGYEKCGSTSSTSFVANAKLGFWKHLQANHNDRISNNNISIIDRKANSYELIKTRQQADSALNWFLAKEREEKNHVIYTNFSWSCDN